MATICHVDGCPNVAPCPDPTHARTRKRSPSSHVTGTARWRRLKLTLLRPGDVCHYCGDPAETLDHRKPVSKGGAPFALSNLVKSCHTCNLRKGNR